MPLTREQLPELLRKAGAILLAVFVSAVLLVLALPLGNWGFLGWFAFVPILRQVRGIRFLPAFVASLAGIFIAAFLSITGIFYHYHDPSGEPSWVYTGFGIFGFAVCIAIGAWGDRGTRNFPLWWFAGLATLAEAYLEVQIPAHLALTQYNNPAVLQLAAVGGIWLISFLMWWFNFWLASLPLKQCLSYGFAVCPIWILLSLIHFPSTGPQVRIGILQTQEPEEDRIGRLQRGISKQNPAFVVWPEFAGIGFVRRGSPSLLADFTGEPGFSPVITSYPDQHFPRPHNTSVLFRNGQMSSPYWKRKLFGSESTMHTPGTSAVAADYGSGKVGLNICYDSCFPEIIRDSARIPGVNVVTDPSIDPSSTNYFFAAMHASYSPFRSAESGVAMVKADAFAFSTATDSFGQIVTQVPPGERSPVFNLRVGTHWTPYKQFGNWFLWLIGVCVPIRLMVEVSRKVARKRKLAKE